MSTCINISRIFLIILACIYTFCFVLKLYRRFAKFAKVFWLVSEHYYVKQSSIMKSFYRNNLYPYLLNPQPHIIKFFDVKQQKKKSKSLNKFDSLSDAGPGSFMTYKSSFGSKSRLSGEFNHSLISHQKATPKNEHSERQMPEASALSSLMFKWLISTTGKWIALLFISIGLGFLNNVMMSQYTTKVALQKQILEIKDNVGRVKALSDLYNYTDQRNTTLLESYIASRKTTLSHLYDLISQMNPINSARSASEDIYGKMFRNLTRSSADSESTYPNGTQTGRLQSTQNLTPQISIPRDSLQLPPDGFLYLSNGSLAYNYTDLRPVLEKGLKHALLSLLNTLDYYLFSPNKESSGVSSEAWICTLEEKLVEILMEELENAELINDQYISSFRQIFLFSNIGSILLMLVILGLAAREWLRFHHVWKESNFNYIINSMNLIADREVEQNPALMRACNEALKECGI
jgi:hypothetical protein